VAEALLECSAISCLRAVSFWLSVRSALRMISWICGAADGICVRQWVLYRPSSALGWLSDGVPATGATSGWMVPDDDDDDDDEDKDDDEDDDDDGCDVLASGILTAWKLAALGDTVATAEAPTEAGAMACSGAMASEPRRGAAGEPAGGAGASTACEVCTTAANC